MPRAGPDSRGGASVVGIEKARLVSDFVLHFPRFRKLARLPVKGIFALVFPKFGALYFHRKNRILKHKGRRHGYAYYLANVYLNGVDINPMADIEEEVRFQHRGAIVIGGDARIGKGSQVFSCVTIGINSAFGGTSPYPVIGEGCYLGTGAKIIGPVTIGDRAVVGANSVVVCDVPPGVVVAGVPARVIRKSDSRGEMQQTSVFLE